jgi:glyceraldehyde 3-phosphate dehydrogenase
MVDLVVQTEHPASIGEVLSAFRRAAEEELLGVLEVEHQELVSCDFLGRSCSAIVDAAASSELNPNVSVTTLTLSALDLLHGASI